MLTVRCAWGDAGAPQRRHPHQQHGEQADGDALGGAACCCAITAAPCIQPVGEAPGRRTRWCETGAKSPASATMQQAGPRGPSAPHTWSPVAPGSVHGQDPGAIRLEERVDSSAVAGRFQSGGNRRTAPPPTSLSVSRFSGLAEEHRLPRICGSRYRCQDGSVQKPACVVVMLHRVAGAASSRTAACVLLMGHARACAAPKKDVWRADLYATGTGRRT